MTTQAVMETGTGPEPATFRREADGVTIDRPERRNALNLDVKRRLTSIVETLTEAPSVRELVLGEFGQVAITGEEPADPTVRILDRTFLPGAVRIAEIGLGAGRPCKESIGGELGAAVEGDGPAASFRQPLPGLADPPDQCVGLAIRVGQQDGVAGLAFDHAGQVGLAVLASEDQQIGLPMPEGLAISDLGWPVLDRAAGGNGRAARLAAVAWLAPAACLGQMAMEPGFAAFGAVNIAVDGLVADRTTVGSFMLEPPGDLLG